MLHLWERWIQFQELYLKSEPEHAPEIALTDVMPLWRQRIKANQAVKLINNETAAIRVVDVREYKRENAVVLLLQYSDLNVTDPVFSDLKKGTLRKEPKLEGEGVAVSCHVVLSLEPIVAGKPSYRLLLEEIPGLGRSRLTPFIRSELKHVSADLFTFKDVDDGNKVKKYRPSAELLGEPSKQLLDELEGQASIQSFELVKYTKKNPGIDEAGFYHEESQLLRLVPYKPYQGTAEAMLEKVKALAKKEKYDNVKIRYKCNEGNKQKTATMGSTIGDLSDAMVLRSEMIKADKQLDQCEEKIVLSLSNKMIKLLGKT